MGFGVESASVTFSGTDTATYTFTQSYPYPPIVTATADQDVNVFITSISKTQVTLETSANFSGEVHFQAIMIGVS